MTQESSSARLSTLEKSAAIVEQIRQRRGSRVTELADDLELAPSTVHSHVATLEDLEFLVKQGDEYHVGLRFLDLGGHARHVRPNFELTKQKVDELVAETGERVQYLVEEHGKGIYLYTKTGTRAVQINARVGRTNPLHSSAAGKAIMATYSEDCIHDIVDMNPLIQRTENTITDRDELFAELDQIRDQGYSFNRQESIDGLHAVGVAVTDHNNTAVGALSVSGPSNRLTGEKFEEELPQLLLGASNELELKIAYS